MGFRTVVVLNNDQAHEWQNDPELGKKIMQAGYLRGWSKVWFEQHPDERLQYGEVIEQVHADTQTVAFLDGYGGKAMAYSHWFRGETEDQKNLKMLKSLADSLGYRISKKPQKK